ACFTSVADLIAAIEDYIAHHNADPKPYKWTNRRRDHREGAAWTAHPGTWQCLNRAPFSGRTTR
ncbi:MAG: hypothetical protein J2P57_23900, partial [Acidimicrobiaceae bacterium]|nr:hypothetical protein [Acidimicrobiaceae bacterium]